jgi:hypothetical protein
MKTFADISKGDFISKIDKIVHDERLSTSLAEFSQKIRAFNQENSKPNFLKSSEEKKEFLNKIKTTEEFNIIKDNPDIAKELVNNDFFEFLLPYVMVTHNIDEYKNVELIGLGFYESNQDILSE